MAARWGTGEEILTAHNMEFFSTASLDEAGALQGALVVDCMEGQGLHAGDVVETLHGCLDPSILSIFEDPPTGETKIGIDEESEATLLTALTEVLDNVDDENLSPFDTLPDVELLTGQKGHEHSPLRKLFCLSRSPPDRESMFNTRSFSSPGKSLPRMPSVTIQRSDGEDEEEATHLSDIEPTVDLLDWSSVALEQDGSCVSVTLGDLVKHMHCMAVCLEDGTDEQMLPEGGILLEVVDQGEHGEPILAIPDLSVEHPGTGSCQEVPDQTPVTSQQCPTLEADVSVLTATPPPQPGLEGQEEKVVIKRPKEEVTEKCPSRRKKKRKNKEAQSPPVSEGRVLRSAKKDLEKKPQEEQKQQQQKKMKKKVTSAPAISAQALEKVAPVPQAAVIDPQVMPQTPIDMNPAPKSDELRMDATAPKHSSAPESPPVPTQSTSPVPVPTAVPSEESVDMCVQEKAPEEVVASEPKPKPLSLQQYRLLRQQKRPAPLEKAGDNSTKWPSLPEAPKELPPIPCLQQPSPKDPRKASAPAASKEPAPEVKAVWQPKGLAAPPTPEALLVPPASLVAASSKPAVPKPAPVQASPSSSPASSLTPAPVPPPAPTPTSSSQPQSQSPSPAPLASSQNTTTSQASPCSPQPATALPAVYNDAPLPSATTPTASQVLKAIVSQPRIAQLLAAALKGQKLPVVSPQVRSDAPAQSDVYPRTTTEVQPAATAAAAVVTAATAPPKVVASPPPAAAAVSAAPSQAVKRPEQPTVMPKSEPVKVALPVTVTQQRQVPVAAASVPAAVPTPSVVSAQSQSRTLSAQPAQQKQTPAVVPPKGKSQTEELIESFTSEIGIEASDLASLLEQFEETQAKVERSVPEVFGRAAAVGNSSVEPAIEGKALEGTKVHDLGSTAGLTPPGTPPHQMWKPLVPAVLQGRSKTTDGIKQIPTKLTIQIDPRPLPANRLRGKAQPMAPNPTAFQPFSPDHDYCLPSKETSPEAGKRFNIKHQPSFTIRTVELPPKVRQQSTTPCPPAADGKSASGAPHPLDEQALASSVLVTPDASPSRVEPEGTSMKSPKRECSSGHQLCSPSPCCRKRGRARRRQSDHSRSSSSGSSSRSSSRSQSRSPPRKRCYRSRHSESTSSSRSRSRSRSRSQSQSPHRRRRYSYSSSRSGSWSRSRSRSNSPDSHRYWRSEHIPRSSRYSSRERQEDTKRRKEKAIEERRVVYVGRIRGGMTRAELKERFSQYGEIEDCTLHFREHGDNYGFVTYYDTKDAFTAIENGSKLRRPNELPFDLCFGGRRQFCKTSYADLDSSREYDPTSSKRKFDALDFDTLLKQAQRNLKR